MYRQGAFGAVLAAVERISVGAALALRVDVDAPDLVGEDVDQAADGRRVIAEQAQLLAVVGVQYIVDHCLQVAVGHHRYQRAELLFVVHAHFPADRVQQGRVEE
ncbi:hypothetical protein D3C71_1842280 [compost metagenome]